MARQPCRTASSQPATWLRPAGKRSCTAVPGKTKVITVLGSTYGSLERQIEEALEGVEPEQLITISYAVSRIFGVSLQHHALIVLRHD